MGRGWVSEREREWVRRKMKCLELDKAVDLKRSVNDCRICSDLPYKNLMNLRITKISNRERNETA